MKIFFIRHAEAIEREEWTGDDMSRPLTAKGKRTASAMADFLRMSDNQPQRFISSEAIRAKETAAIFAGRTRVQISQILNPGCTMNAFGKLLKKCGQKKGIAVVGHEPDFSVIMAELIGDGSARIKMAKAACAIVEYETGCGRLLALLSPAMSGKKFPRIGKKRARNFQSLEKTGGRRLGAR